jgi:hypothetical protein
MRKIFGPKRDEVTGDWVRVHKDELHGFCFSPNITPVIKSRRITWAGHVARRREGRGAYTVSVEKPD